MSDTEERVASISHGAFIDILLKALLNQLPGKNLYYRHYNTAISRLSIKRDAYTEIRSLNKVDHLPADLVS